MDVRIAINADGSAASFRNAATGEELRNVAGWAYEEERHLRRRYYFERDDPAKELGALVEGAPGVTKRGYVQFADGTLAAVDRFILDLRI
jgi:hypothetical protein